jgi:hypothetical protein
MPAPTFSIQKLMNYGSATPCVARTCIQTAELLQPFPIPEEKKVKAGEVAYRVMNHLVACLDVTKRFEAEISAGEEVVAKGVTTQAGGQVADLPSILDLQKDFESFLYNAKLTLRDTGGLFEVFHEKPFDHKYHKARQWAEEEFGPESPLARLLAGDAAWIELVLALRNAVEHPRDARGPLHVRDFSIARDADGRPGIAAPCWWREDDESAPIKDTVIVFQDNLLTFYEDLLCVMLDQLPNPWGVAVVEIPVGERDPEKPLRFGLDFSALAQRITQERQGGP